jgi:hypothetical protein
MKRILSRPNFLAIIAAALLCFAGVIFAQTQTDPPEFAKAVVLTFPVEGQRVTISKECFIAALNSYAKKAADGDYRLHRLTWAPEPVENIPGGIDGRPTERSRAVHVAQTVAFDSPAELAAFSKAITDTQACR